MGKSAAMTEKKMSRAGRSSTDPEAELQRLRELLKLMQEHDLTELEIGPDGGSVRLSKRGPDAPVYAAAPAAAPPAAAAAGAAAAPLAESAAEGGEAAADPNVEVFHSPMVGTFYRKPSPEAPSYVVEGDDVEPDTTLCMIEAMKVFNEIKAEVKGKVIEIMVDNGEAVEFGQPLFAVRKAG
jgi:acetyl-CoA carboxylase biotin carboxyl carrier protein